MGMTTFIASEMSIKPLRSLCESQNHHHQYGSSYPYDESDDRHRWRLQVVDRSFIGNPRRGTRGTVQKQSQVARFGLGNGKVRELILIRLINYQPHALIQEEKTLVTYG